MGRGAHLVCYNVDPVTERTDRTPIDDVRVRIFSAASLDDRTEMDRLVESGAERDGRSEVESSESWAFFPWTGKLVRIPSESALQERRASRIQADLPSEERTKLASLRVGVVGLSRGTSTALTLAREGIGGTFRLADLDDQGSSNAVFVAREILQIFPYARVELFPRGIGDDSMDAFFGDPSAPLDLLFEECDDLRVKALLRREAQRRHVATGVEGLRAYEKVPILVALLGAESMSARLAVSLGDIEERLKREAVDDVPIRDDDAPISFAPVSAAPSIVETLVRHATLAPSCGNAQPWVFSYASGVLHCIHDRKRSASFLDFEDRATLVAFGALAENVRLSAAAQRIAIRIEAFPRRDDPSIVCDAIVGGPAPPPNFQTGRLAAQIDLRVTNRKLGPRAPITDDETAPLVRMAEAAGAELRLVQSDRELTELGEILGRAEKLRFLSPIMHREMMAEMRWTSDEATQTRDGLDVTTLELSVADTAAMKLLRNPSIVEMLGAAGDGLAQPSRRALAAASAFGLVRVPLSNGEPRAVRAAYFRGGSAMQRVWLEAGARGWAVQPMTSIVFLVARLDAVTPTERQGLTESEIADLTELRSRFRGVFGQPKGAVEVFAFRLAKADPPAARSLRRHPGDVLRIAAR